MGCCSAVGAPEMRMNMSIILDKVNYVYSEGTAYQIQALKDVNLTIEDGQFIGVIHLDPALERSDEGDIRDDLFSWSGYL